MRSRKSIGVRLILAACFALGSAAALAEELDIPVRNPFWPQGYNGKRYPITTEPRFRVERPKTTGDGASVRASDNSITAYEMSDEDPVTRDPVWQAAAKTLRFGSMLSYSADDGTQAAIEINGRVYAIGDLISLNFKDLRLTWRVESLSFDGKLKLKRLTYRKIGATK